MAYWLFKSEPDTFSIDDLARSPSQVTAWEGVRNYQARNLLRDEVRLGDEAYFYHSSCKEPGIMVVMEVVRTGYPDISAFDPDSPYFDPKSTPQTPRWFAVDVKFKYYCAQVIPLSELRTNPSLRGMALLRRGNRLSILPVTPAQWRFIQIRWRARV